MSIEQALVYSMIKMLIAEH